MTAFLAPSGRLWDALGPLVGMWRGLEGVLETCAAYGPWCLAALLGLALLMGTGLVAADWGTGPERDLFAERPERPH